MLSGVPISRRCLSISKCKFPGIFNCMFHQSPFVPTQTQAIPIQIQWGIQKSKLLLDLMQLFKLFPHKGYICTLFVTNVNIKIIYKLKYYYTYIQTVFRIPDNNVDTKIPPSMVWNIWNLGQNGSKKSSLQKVTSKRKIMEHCQQYEGIITIAAYSGLLLQGVHIAGSVTSYFDMYKINTSPSMYKLLLLLDTYCSKY